MADTAKNIMIYLPSLNMADIRKILTKCHRVRGGKFTMSLDKAVVYWTVSRRQFWERQTILFK